MSRPYRLVALALSVGAVCAATFQVHALVTRWADEGIVLVDAHLRHDVAHPGWSFPARIRTAAADRQPPIEIGWMIGPDAEIRFHLPLTEAPPHLVDAILASEDRNFQEHIGVDPTAMVRATIANAENGAWSQGGSTLTMQVVRSLTQAREKTLLRKMREMVLAVAIDDHIGKEGVLQMYLDAPYLGQRGGLSICGFEAASLHYFGKPAAKLTLAQAATLVGILPSPMKFDPARYPVRARVRRDLVLHAMAEFAGYDVAEALASPIGTTPPLVLPERFPAYLSATRAWLEQHVPPVTLYGAGLVVTVGLDVAAQEETDLLFPEKISYFESLIGRRGDSPLQAAAVLMDTSNGLIRAVYGGSDVTATSFNRATQARRQPGSAFKPVVYALAFSQRNPDGTPRFTASHAEPNEQRIFRTPQGDWQPKNVAGKYTPTACLAYALAWSQNIATAALLEEMGGAAPLVAFAGQLGFDTSRYPVELGLALGQGEATVLEMTQFAATVANGGRLVIGTPVLGAVDASGVVRLGPPLEGKEVMSQETAALTRELMRIAVEGGSGSGVRGRGGVAGYLGPAMGKTGTTDRERDVWFMGATPKLAGAVWLGYDEPTSVGGSAADLAAPLWGWWLGGVTKAKGAAPGFPDEPRVVRRTVCAYTGERMGETCLGMQAPFVPGTEPTRVCPIVHPPEVKEVEVPKPGHESMWRRLDREKTEASLIPGE